MIISSGISVSIDIGKLFPRDILNILLEFKPILYPLDVENILGTASRLFLYPQRPFQWHNDLHCEKLPLKHLGL